MKTCFAFLSLVISLNSFCDPADYPREHLFSFFEKFYMEKESQRDFVIVEIKDSLVTDILWTSPKADLQFLRLGSHVDSFFNHETEFPIGPYEHMIAILYSSGGGIYERVDDGHDSDSYVYDDRLLFKESKLYPIYGEDVFPGIKSLSKEEVEAIINLKLKSRPKSIRCSHLYDYLPTVPMKNGAVMLNSDYLGNEEVINIHFNESDNRIIFDYKLLGDDPSAAFDSLPEANDIYYEDGFYKGRVSLKFDPYFWESIKFPQDLLFKENKEVSARFKAALTPVYYGFLEPRVCSFERTL